MESKYNLLYEDWIEFESKDGKRELGGILDVLKRAHEIKSLSNASASSNYGILRLLLSFVHACYDDINRSKWVRLWERGSFDDALIGEYASKFEDRFFLIDGKYPFLQYPGLTNYYSNGEKVSMALKDVVLPISAYSKTLFSHNTNDYLFKATYKETVEIFLDVLLYSFAGLFRKMSTLDVEGELFRVEESPLINKISLSVHGENLFETLALNMLNAGIMSDGIKDLGVPIWERDIVKDKGRLADKYQDYLVPLSRIVRLIESDDAEGYMDRVALTEGLNYKTGVPDAFTMTRVDEKKGVVPVFPRLGKALWREFGSLVSIRGEDRFKIFHSLTELGKKYLDGAVINCCSHVYYNASQGKMTPEMYVSDGIKFPAGVIGRDEKITEAIHLIGTMEKMATAVYGGFWYYLELSGGGDPDKNKKVARKEADNVLSRYWRELGTDFNKYLFDELDYGDCVSGGRRYAEKFFVKQLEAYEQSNGRQMKAYCKSTQMLRGRLRKIENEGEVAKKA